MPLVEWVGSDIDPGKLWRPGMVPMGTIRIRFTLPTWALWNQRFTKQSGEINAAADSSRSWQWPPLASSARHGWASCGSSGPIRRFGTVEEVSDHYLPDVRSLNLDLPDLGQLSEVYTADGVLLGTLTERNSQPLPIEEIPDLVIQAILAAEDARYYEHEGIDFRAILRAAIEDARGGRRQGGSTLTQQVVKQNFIGSEQTIERKAREAVIAAELERRYSKDDILEFYLNSVFFGWNAYGVKAAAAEYFGKDLETLTVSQAAALATPIRNPSLYDMRRNPAIVERTRNAIIDNMAEEGFITPATAKNAKRDPVAPVPHQEVRAPCPPKS